MRKRRDEFWMVQQDRVNYGGLAAKICDVIRDIQNCGCSFLFAEKMAFDMSRDVTALPAFEEYRKTEPIPGRTPRFVLAQSDAAKAEIPT